MRGSFADCLLYNSTTNYTTNKALLLSAVYRCVEVISDSVAQLPLEPFRMDKDGYKVKYIEHPTYRLLNKEPNPRMSRFSFMKTLVVSTLLTGNGYAYIERDVNGNAKGLHFIPSELVTPIIPKKLSESMNYNVTGIGLVESCNMIHILNFTYDGINGVSTLANAKNTLGASTDAEAHAAGFFKGGANLAGLLKVNSTLNDKQRETLKRGWQLAFSPTTGNPNGVAILEGNMEFEPITVNPSDA